MAVGFYIFSILITICIDLAAPIVCCVSLCQNGLFSDNTFWNIWLFMRLIICMVDGVISLVCIICILCNISKKWLVMILYIFMEILVGCYSATAFFISESDIAQIPKAVVRLYLSNIIPAQYLELLAFSMVLICFLISFCQTKSVPNRKENREDNLNPTPIAITMAPPENLQETTVNTIDFSLDNDVHQPLLQEPIISAVEEISSTHIEEVPPNDNTVVIIPSDHENTSIPQVVTILDPPAVVDSISPSVSPVEENNQNTTSDLPEEQASASNVSTPTVHIVEDVVPVEEPHVEVVDIPVPSENPANEPNEQPPSLDNLPPPPSRKLHRPYTVYANAALQPVIAEMNEVVQSRRSNQAEKEDSSDSIGDLAVDHTSVKCSLCNKENATVKVDPCEDVFCTSCLTNTGRCPACGCIICNVYTIE